MKKFLLGLMVIVAMALTGCDTVEPGQVGLKVCWGTVESEVLSPGVYPTYCTVKTFSTRTASYTMAGNGQGGEGSVHVLTRDQLQVDLDVTSQYHLDPAATLPVFTAFGERYEETIIHPLVRTAVRDAASEFNAVALVDERARLQNRMETLVREQLRAILRSRRIPETAVTIDNILLRNVDLPQSLDEAIAAVQRERQLTSQRQQAQLTAEQDAHRVLTVANGDSAAMLARTRADAEALQIRTDAQAAANRALAASLTPQVLELRRIEAQQAVLQSNGTRTVFLPPQGHGTTVLMSAPQ